MPVGSIYILNLEGPMMPTVVIFLGVNLGSVYTRHQTVLNCWKQRCRGWCSGDKIQACVACDWTESIAKWIARPAGSPVFLQVASQESL